MERGFLDLGNLFDDLMCSFDDFTSAAGSWISDLKTSFMSSLSSWFTDVCNDLYNLWHSIQSINASITDFYWGILESFGEWISSVVDRVIEFKDGVLSWFSGFFSNLGTFLHDLFIPSEGYFQDNVNALKDALSDKLKYNQLIDGLSQFKDLSSSAPADITCDLYGHTITVVDWSSIQSVQPIIYFLVRGFFYPFILIYHFNQVYKLIRGQSYTASGKPGSDIQSGSGIAGQQYWDWGSK